MAQVFDPKQQRVWLPAGITEAELIRSVLPEYDEKLVRWEKSKEDHLLFRASVSEGLPTDLGFPGRRFILFAVTGQEGICAQCYFASVGVFDLEARRLLFRRDREGRGPAPAVKTFRLAWTDQRVCISFRMGESNLNFGGYSRTSEEWHCPRLPSEGALKFNRVWSGLVGHTHTDNTTWDQVSACGQMHERQTPGEYEYRLKEGFGNVQADIPAPAVRAEPRWNWDTDCLCEQCGVEVRTVERWESVGNRLQRRTREVSRVDRFAVARFPFNLPVRKDRFNMLNARGEISMLVRGETRVTSPAGDRHVILDSPSPYRRSLRVVSAASGKQLREVTVVEDVFVGAVESVGWEENGRRIFAVARVGERTYAVLSFSSTGRDDYWEDLVDGDSPLLDHGFVLARTDRKGRR